MAYTLRDDQFWPTGGVVAGHSSWRSRSRRGRRRCAARALDPLVRHPRLAVRAGRARLRARRAACSATPSKTSPRSRSSTRTASSATSSRCSTACSTARSAGSRCSSSGRRSSSRPTSSSARPKTRSSCTAPTSSTRSATTSTRCAREAFAADGFDPDRQVFVYQFFAHHAFATALRGGRRAEPRRRRRAAGARARRGRVPQRGRRAGPSTSPSSSDPCAGRFPSSSVTRSTTPATRRGCHADAGELTFAQALARDRTGRERLRARSASASATGCSSRRATRADYLLSWLALMEVGAIQVPINPKSTAGGVAGLRAAGRPALVVTDARPRADRRRGDRGRGLVEPAGRRRELYDAGARRPRARDRSTRPTSR